mgnify:FL=1|jgi:hypothetical protein|tara:strand:+ start:11041 stop:11502 length:462 start_codon:yes stop_codon:yes gene_type:complete
MESITIRPIEEDDYKFINEWWVRATGKTPPKRALLPGNGLHGLMACKNKKPVMCTYLYTTNSKMGYCDYMIGDPKYREKDRQDILLKLMVGAIKGAHELGYEDFWFLTKEKGLLSKCEKLGVEISKEKYHVVTLPMNKTKLDNDSQILPINKN